MDEKTLTEYLNEADVDGNVVRGRPGRTLIAIKKFLSVHLYN
jgi:predicted RNA-binding protein YlqC (UPF0109 family)